MKTAEDAVLLSSLRIRLTGCDHFESNVLIMNEKICLELDG